MNNIVLQNNIDLKKHLKEFTLDQQTSLFKDFENKTEIEVIRFHALKG